MGKKERNLICSKLKQYEKEYLCWARERDEFNKRLEQKVYYRKNGSKTRRLYAQKCVQDFPNIVMRELHAQIGGCREIIVSYNLVPENDYYWSDDYRKWRIFYDLRKKPTLIYNIMENTFEYSKKICERTSDTAVAVSEIIEDIASGKAW